MRALAAAMCGLFLTIASAAAQEQQASRPVDAATKLIDVLVPIYAAHLTRSELDDLVRFYTSPLGQRLTAVQPDILRESTVAGQQWGEVIGRMVGDSLARAQGNLPPNR